MKLRVERKRILLWLWINLFVMVVQLVVLTSSRPWSVRELVHMWAFALVYANVTGIPAILMLPGFVYRMAVHRFPLLPVMVSGILFFILTGCLVAQTLLWWAGMLPSQFFWSWYLRILPQALLGALVFGLSVFFYESLQERLRKTEERLHEKEIMEERAQKLVAEARLDSLQSRLHPHFLFNTLNSISSLIVGDPALAEKTVGRLAALLRSSLDNTSQSLIPLRQELAMIQDYFEIERVRFGSKLKGLVDVPEQLYDASVPPLSVLTLVENAVKHGITTQREGGEFRVAASRQESDASLRIEVRDTGPGFNLASIDAGHGLDNLVGRLDALFGDRAHLKVFERDGWCVVQMVLPLS
jgi:sensor histidine kinase YesM